MFFLTCHYNTGRHRWVWYAKNVDSTALPPEWHAWLHYFTDEIPSEETIDEYAPKRYGEEPKPNPTGTEDFYSPRAFIGNKNWSPLKDHWAMWNPNQHAKQIPRNEL